MRFNFQRRHLSIPYVLFLLLFVILPILVILFYAFSNEQGQLSFSAFTKFFSDMTNLNTILISLLYGFINTFICLLIGYPVAMILANKKYNKNIVMVMLFIMPMWVNFVLRTMATRDLLFWLGLSGAKYPEFATIVGLVYNYLPFVILPLYSTMLKMDHSQIEAAMDLGANRVQTFIKVIIPMTMPGIVAASTMVFMPTMSSYVISNILSEGNIVLFGETIANFFALDQWNQGSFMALIMLVFIGASALITRKSSKNENARVNIW